jgi:hypothetical protein
MATYNEEVTLQERFTAWMITSSDGLSRVKYTDKPMTPQQALKHFKGASGVMGFNSDRNVK